MYFLLQRKLSDSSQGIDLADTEIVADRITIGIDSEREIQLDGEGIASLHAELRASPTGLEVICLGNNRIEVGGKLKKKAALAFGDSFSLAGWAFTVIQPPAGFDAAVQLDQNETALKSVRLPSAMDGVPGLKSLSYALVIAILVIAFLAPLFSDSVRDATGISTAGLWSSGPLHAAHQHPDVGEDCAVCHSKAFQRVKDDACMQCHQSTAAHGSLNSHASGLMDNVGRCASCHREHNEPEMLVIEASALCTDCHKQVVEDSSASVPLANVFAFTKDGHPEFSVTRSIFIDDERRWDSERQALEASLEDSSNLKFNHRIHLDESRVQDLASGEKLDCQGCHTLLPDGEHFEPISMDNNCRSCHSLSMAAFGKERLLPHGQPEEVAATIEEYYIAMFSKKAIGLDVGEQGSGTPRRRLPGKGNRDAECKAGPVKCGMQAAKESIDEQFSVSGCVTCHYIEERAINKESVGWHVQPVKLVNDWFLHGRFSHSAHMVSSEAPGESCAGCHQATVSESNQDILMPGIEVCLACHESSHENAIELQCVDCHDFHSNSQNEHWSTYQTPKSTFPFVLLDVL